MTKKILSIPLLLAAVTLVSSPAAAQDIGFKGWGIRAGVADDPDQVVLGAQANFGELIENLRFQPNVELGVGDDTTVLSATAPVFYRLLINQGLVLYGGGGATLGWIDRDDDGDDDSGFEIAPVLAGGLEWPLRTNELFAELAVTGGDFQNVKLMFGWMF